MNGLAMQVGCPAAFRLHILPAGQLKVQDDPGGLEGGGFPGPPLPPEITSLMTAATPLAKRMIA